MEKQTLKALVTHLKANNAIQKVLRKDMIRYGVSPSEFTVLELLNHQKELPIQVIANKVLLTSGSMTYVIQQLQKKEFIQRNVSRQDQRICVISLTEKGRRFIERNFITHKQTIDWIFSVLTHQEVELWIELHKKVGYAALSRHEYEQNNHNNGSL